MFFESAAVPLPQAYPFRFPPNPNLRFVPPPPAGSTSFSPPIDIPDHVYNALLDPKVPIIIAVIYIMTVKAFNTYNKSTGKRPWAISKIFAFRLFIIAHNMFLAVYSAWTWCGIYGTLKRSIISPFGPQGISGFVDSLCRVNGPSGLGNAAFFNDDTNSWQTYSADAVLDADGVPNRFSAGRMWNEGLAFYGWLFYLSKLYEVFDTLIILAKGKLSSTLQTYHHTGAIICMWASVRYMSASSSFSIFFNSFIHTLMYTYYTLTAFNIRVPMVVKRTLTTMQITQFLLGVSCAIVQLFITYTVPVLTGSRTDTAESTVLAGANNFGITAVGGVFNNVQSTYAHRMMRCVTSSGETFVVWLGISYLAPLTYLFVSFFVKTYFCRDNADQSGSRGVNNTAISAQCLSDYVPLSKKAT
ncbi:hypothetical protein VTI28DRAFT_3167 [Corynascus sepedonium]